jgi:signal transduction histidine kinase
MDYLTLNNKQFEIQSNNDLKRTFTMNVQQIVLADVKCQLLLITEQTAFF